MVNPNRVISFASYFKVRGPKESKVSSKASEKVF